MDFTALVDVGTGLTVVYLGASLFVTVLNEYIAQLFNLRGRQLAKDLQKLVSSEKIRKKLAGMPAFGALFCDGSKTATSYVDPTLLAVQLGALVAAELPRRTEVQGPATSAREDDPPKDDPLNTQLWALWELSGHHRDVFVLHLGTWIEKSLTAMGEVYKKRMQMMSFGVGLLLAVILNLDTVRIADHLWKDKQSRGILAAIGVESARTIAQEQMQRCTTTRATTPQAAGAVESVTDPECDAVYRLAAVVANRTDTGLRLPIGWTSMPSWADFSVVVCCGWILTALAVSLGASFWFDALKRLVNVRSGMKKPEV